MNASYEDANDVGVPQEEMILAKLLQTANAKGLRSCRRAFFKKGHKPIEDIKVTEGKRRPTSCCAMGAQMLDPERVAIPFGNVIDGNDGKELTFAWWQDAALQRNATTGYTIGAAFYEACRR